MMLTKQDIPYIKASKKSYQLKKRDKNSIKYIVIHYTGNDNDTAINNALYFKNGNDRKAGAHFFIDRNGNCIKSVAMNLSAYSVGGFYTEGNGAGTYYKKCTNTNSISIELCDIAHKNISFKQKETLKELIDYIKKECPNIKKIIRHWDVNGKDCPTGMTGDSKKWKELKKYIDD